MSLLDPDELAPVRVLREAGTSPWFLIADHAGRVIPRALGDMGLDEVQRGRHIAWDIGIAGVTQALAEALDATAVFQTYSRLVIDCNRPHGVESSIPLVSEATPIPGNRGLTAADIDARRREIFLPYHTRITELLDARAKAGRETVLLSMHSFTPVFLGETRRVEVGMLYGDDSRLAHVLLRLLQAEGDLVVGDNEPYSVSAESDYAVPVHGIGRALLHTAIEIRQDLITEPASQMAWAARLARLLPLALAKVNAISSAAGLIAAAQ
jgi:predicted N-formylglutamate amidohydrolase